MTTAAKAASKAMYRNNMREVVKMTLVKVTVAVLVMGTVRRGGGGGGRLGYDDTPLSDVSVVENAVYAV